jgi:ribonuclease HI
MAAIEGQRAPTWSCEVEVVTDSDYLCRGMTEFLQHWRSNGWKAASGNPVLNQDLWWELAELPGYHRVTWIHVWGTQGHADQERRDALAFESARHRTQDSAAEC